MRSSHAGTFTESQLPFLKRRSAYPAAQLFISCPLCNYQAPELSSAEPGGSSLEDLSNHIAAHLQSIAIISLPWRDDLDENASSNRTSVPKARDSSFDLEDNQSALSFDDTPHNFNEINDDGNRENSGMESRDDEWDFVVRPFYEGPMTDPILRRFVFDVKGSFKDVTLQDMLDSVRSINEIINHMRKFTGGPELRPKLLGKLHAVLNILLALQKRLHAAEPEDPWLESLLKETNQAEILPEDSPFVRLRTCLQAMKKTIVPHSDFQKPFQRGLWPFDDNKLRESTSELTAIHQQFSSIMNFDHVKVILETNTLELAHYWSPLDFSKRQDQISSESIGSGEWFFESLEFRTWVSGRPWTLCIHGNPGVGKVGLSFNFFNSSH